MSPLPPLSRGISAQTGHPPLLGKDGAMTRANPKERGWRTPSVCHCESRHRPELEMLAGTKQSASGMGEKNR